MAIIPFPFSDNPGIAKDIAPQDLPSGLWSDGKNMLFRNRKASKAFGYTEYIGTTTISPRALFFCPLNLSGFWIYPGLTKCYAFDIAGTKANITNSGGDYTGGEDSRWNFCFLHGLGIVNNGTDLPQLWSPPSLATTLVALTNWPASTYAKVMRSYLNFLIALDVTKSSGTRYAQMVKWSHPADAGAVPSSWDEADATKLAGENLLSETPGVLIDCLPLGGANIVYKEDATYSMTYIGGQYVFGFQRLPLSFGLLAQDCAVQLERQHFAVTNNDIVIHDGVTAVSIVAEKDRQWIFDALEQGGKTRAFAFPYHSRGEVWFCFSQTGGAVPDLACIWNKDRNSITFRDLPHVRSAVYVPALRLSAADTWDEEAVLTWAAETTKIWDDPSYINIKERVLFINEDDGTIDQFDTDSYDAKGTAERSFLERQSMPFYGVDKDGKVVADMKAVKFVQELWPWITGTTGATVDIYVGTQDEVTDDITWLDPVTFTIGTTDFIPVYASCRFLSIRLEATGTDLWEWHGMEYSIQSGGVF
jgi:hypothetical protein